eukprot:1378910-Pyramimonas_sp.AAC.1
MGSISRELLGRWDVLRRHLCLPQYRLSHGESANCAVSIEPTALLAAWLLKSVALAWPQCCGRNV